MANSTLSENGITIASNRYFLEESEDWEKLSYRVGGEVSRAENGNTYQYRDQFAEIIYNMEFLPGGRILRNTGRPRGSLFNCYVLPVGDSREEIGQWLKDSLILWGEGGGVGCNLSYLRPRGAAIKGVGGNSSGPVSFLEASDAVANTIESGGSRRAAALACMNVSHPDIMEFIDAKMTHGKLSHYNISVAVTEDFLTAVEADKMWQFKFAQQSYGEIKAREIWNKIIDNMVKYAEPGLLHWDNLTSNNSYYFSPIIATNPCFAADTKILTKEGHFEIQDLIDKEVSVWDGIDWITIDNFRVTGENQEMLKIIFYDGSELRTTPYHKFYLENGSLVEANELKSGDKLYLSNAPIVHGVVEEKGAYIKGFLLGDGSVKRMDEPLLRLYEPKYCCEEALIQSAFELDIENINTNAITKLEFKYEEGNDRKNLTGLVVRKKELHRWGNEYKTKLPKEIFQWDLKSKREFLAGYFDADGSIMDNENGFGYQIWAVSEDMLLDIQLLLKTIGVQSKLSIGKKACKKDFNDGYGEYECRDTYRLTISQRYSIEFSKIVKFKRLKDFSNREIKYNIKNRFNRVVSIEKSTTDEKVYCCTVPGSHKVSLSLGILTGQCGEVPLSANGVCDLGSIVLPNFVTTNGQTRRARLEEVVRLGIRFLDNVIDINKYVLNEIDVNAHAGRRVGLGVMGLAEYLFAKGVRYGSEKAIEETESIMKLIRNTAYETSVQLAMEKGAFPKFDSMLYGKAHFVRSLPAKLRMSIKENGIRNVTCMAMAPTGTISLLPEVSSGIEPLFGKAYLRNDRVSDRIYIHPIYLKHLESGEKLPEWFVDTTDLSPADHFEIQSAVQKYTDGAVSKTINMPKNTTSKELSKFTLEYINDLKGVTVYVDGSREMQIVTHLPKKEVKKYLKTGDVSSIADELSIQCATGACEI